MFLDIQKGENAVVKPKAGEVCEQFTIYDFETEKNELLGYLRGKLHNHDVMIDVVVNEDIDH